MSPSRDEQIPFTMTFSGTMPREALGLVPRGDISHLSPSEVAAVLGPIAANTSLRLEIDTSETSPALYDERFVTHIAGPEGQESLPIVDEAGLRAFGRDRGYSKPVISRIVNALPTRTLRWDRDSHRYVPAISDVAPYVALRQYESGSWYYAGLRADLLPELVTRVTLGDIKISGISATGQSILQDLASSIRLQQDPTD